VRRESWLFRHLRAAFSGIVAAVGRGFDKVGAAIVALLKNTTEAIKLVLARLAHLCEWFDGKLKQIIHRLQAPLH
jgi:hypothetical protein